MDNLEENGVEDLESIVKHFPDLKKIAKKLPAKKKSSSSKVKVL
jgi:hypothetical protein